MMLVILSGLPGVGKSTVGRLFARAHDGVHVRIDTIEQAIRRSSHAPRDVADIGYQVGYALALDHLRLNRLVVADSVNPLEVTRSTWREVAERASAAFVEVEVVCSDRADHRRRVEGRSADIEGLVLPTWLAVETRDYAPWTRPRLVVDTATLTAEQAAAAVGDAIGRLPDPVVPGRVVLAPPSPSWPTLAQNEAERLREAMGAVLVTVHHIGSTSIPGIQAKPIVDLVPIARDLEAFDRQRAALRRLGYRWHGELGIPGRRYCTLTDPTSMKRVVQLHVFGEGDPQVPRHLAFRDYLRTHPAIARAYEVEKVRAASLHPDDVLAYNDEKGAWIKRTERDALAWYEGH